MNNEQREYQQWLELRKRIETATEPIKDESQAKQKERVKNLLSNFQAFCKYYFPHYIDCDFGWFHLEAAEKITNDKDIFAILEWAREHAKSVFSDVFIPMWLKAKGEFTGMIIASSTGEKASGLLGDIQAELMDNKRYLNDFGEQASFGDWRDGHFTTKDGCGFWAFGRGQSPRGVRSGAKRPNFAVVDDIDDKEIVKNAARVKEAVEWVLEDLYGCLAIEGGRIIIAGNRIHKNSILAHLVGDAGTSRKKRKGITHIKVFATENAQHKKADINSKGARPAWKERYTMEQLRNKMEKMGRISALREYYHEHIEEGLIFKTEWITYTTALPFAQYDSLVGYCDPSFKNTKDSDYKAIMLIGSTGKYIDILRAFVRQTSVSSMVKGYYDLFDEYGNFAKYYMEANMLQDMLLIEFDTEAESRGYSFPIRKDKTKKPDKYTRIENMTPLFERRLIRIAESERENDDMQVFIDQLLGFGNAAIHDDAPDALEGAITKIQKLIPKNRAEPRSGKYNKKSR
jgi:predicted phage terminase large subunit-like protein